eukprot:m.716100 g.716100  ORF g.716100 m.716100 type:complete len:105 (+) comp22982_c0_seq1:414-728(+)
MLHFVLHLRVHCLAAREALEAEPWKNRISDSVKNRFVKMMNGERDGPGASPAAKPAPNTATCPADVADAATDGADGVAVVSPQASEAPVLSESEAQEAAAEATE